jgi:hypothetical protein
MTIDINEYAEGAVILSDLDNAIIGIVEDFNGRRILYSKTKTCYSSKVFIYSN